MPANMRRHAEINLVAMLGVSLLDYRVIDHGFGYVVSCKPGPDFLLDVIRLIGMEIAQADRVL